MLTAKLILLYKLGFGAFDYRLNHIEFNEIRNWV